MCDHFLIRDRGAVNDAGSGDFWVLIGSHLGGPDTLRIARFDGATGKLSTARPIARSSNPGYLIATHDYRFIYACNQADGYMPGVSGGISAFRFDAREGTLTELNRVPSRGRDPSHLAFDAGERHLFVANYGSGSFAVRRIEVDGSIGAETAFRAFDGTGVHPLRQTAPHAHASALDPTGRFVFVCDLGTDRIHILPYDPATGALGEEAAHGEMPPGSGARHLAFHPNGRWLYVDGEMGNIVCRFVWSTDTGTLLGRSAVSTLPPDFAGTSTAAELLIAPDGRTLYITNRGHDSVASFRIDAETGELSLLGLVPSGGSRPRNLAFSPDGRWAIVSNHASNNMAVLRVDAASGRLICAAEPIKIELPYSPLFIPIAS
jgi:6-phosphogluconolactonase